MRKLISLILSMFFVVSLTSVHVSAAGDSMATATSIRFNQSYSGVLAKRATDFYKFTLSSSGRVNFDLTASVPNSYITIYDVNGESCWSHYYIWDNVLEVLKLNRNIDLTSGTYYLEFKRDGDYYTTSTGKYNFTMTFEDSGESFTETTWGTNNSVSTASAITLNKTYTGQIAENDLKDIYKFTVKKAGTFNLRVTGYLQESKYHLYDSNGYEVWSKGYVPWNDVTQRLDRDWDIKFSAGTYYFAIEKSRGTGKYLFTIGNKNPFSDVSFGSYYYDAVMWAVDKGITNGYSDGTFKPKNNCTREAVVTFLWRLAGKPNPKSMTSPFKDVKDSSKYYYKAVLWAAEKGIAGGYNDGTFRPSATCLREHVVTFLWRYAGKPNPGVSRNPFNDVKSSDYYYTAALWANAKGIAKGYSSGAYAGGFGPKLDCLREHVVTFLYRYAQ